MSSGDVSALTNKTFSPLAALLCASAASNAILPVAAPGDAGKPTAIGVAFFNAAGLNVGWSNASKAFGSTL